MDFSREYRRIGLNVLFYRRKAGFTQDELARKADISRSRISDIECYKGPYSVETVLRISHALGIDVSKIFENKE